MERGYGAEWRGCLQSAERWFGAALRHSVVALCCRVVLHDGYRQGDEGRRAG